MLNIVWHEQENSFCHWLNNPSAITTEAVTSGYEANTLILQLNSIPMYVLKIWKEEFRVEAKHQYEFLESALAAGLPVPKPVGWGKTNQGLEVLATKFSGYPTDRPTKSQLEEFARILFQIHNVPLCNLKVTADMDTDIIDLLATNFFPGIERHPDIYAILQNLKGQYPCRERRLVHGDFNMGNVLISNGEITVIDWTDVHIGDIRYDLAWACVSLWIYLGEKEYNWFKNVYLACNELTVDELNVFESIAALKWILLNRLVSFPDGTRISEELRAFIEKRLPLEIYRLLD